MLRRTLDTPYAAVTCEALDRVVAVKVLPKKRGENKEFVERFYAEGKAAARLQESVREQAAEADPAAVLRWLSCSLSSASSPC